MTIKFFGRVMREGVVDTRKYRYVLRTRCEGDYIERIALNDLDTVAALDGWEIVWTGGIY